MIKKAIKYLLGAAGYELISKKTFGYDVLTDLRTLLGAPRAFVLFDIGANIGQTSLEFNAGFNGSRIYAFEPDPSAFSKLKEATKQFSTITPYNIGFGTTSEKVQMNLNRNSGGNSILPLSEHIGDFAVGEWTEKVGSAEIELSTLDEFCKAQQVKGIDVLKMDVQGYELKILEGAKKTVTPAFTKIVFVEVLFVELYKDQAYFDQVYAELTGRGYKLAGLYNKFHNTRSPHYLLWCDAVFTSEDLNLIS